LNGEQLRAQVEERAALRRVATLLARGVAPDEVFVAVTEEAGRLMPVEYAHLGHYESDGTMTIVAGWGKGGQLVPVARRLGLGGKNIDTLVFETGRPAWIDGDVADCEHGFGSGVGTPVIVEGRLWGVMAAFARPGRTLPADTESRLACFAELVATAIANAESRTELARLAEEQAALRRVATLVAGGAPPDEVFAAVTGEVGRLLGSHLAGMARFEGDDTLTVLATWAAEDEHPLVPGPWPLEGGDLGSMVWTTGRSVRIDTYVGVPGPIAAFVRDELGIGSSVASPILAEGRLWGTLFVHAKQTHPPFSADTESRLTGFTELVATAIVNAESRAALAASRARIVAGADEMRRRIERDLHDGIQQRLVALGIEVRTAETAVPPDLGDLRAALSRVADELVNVFDELREIAHGIHPAILSEGGLEPALRALRRRSAVPVELDLHCERQLPQPVEVATYYVVSEGLANAAKHARASVVNVELHTYDTIMRLTIRDDGIGGADPGRGSGLLGLSDRIEALGGTLEVTSTAGNGTTLLIELPLEDESSTRPP
jgi:signal transduction histidine kinase